jgi:hypothetical protein
MYFYFVFPVIVAAKAFNHRKNSSTNKKYFLLLIPVTFISAGLIIKKQKTAYI